MKKAFLVVAGILFVFGTNSDASAQPNIQAPGKVPAGYHANGVEGTIEFISGRHHRRHNHGHFGGNRHSRHFNRGHRQGYNRHYYGGRDLYRLFRPYGNYYSGRHFNRGRGYTGNRNHGGHGGHDRHDRRSRPNRNHSPNHRR